MTKSHVIYVYVECIEIQTYEMNGYCIRQRSSTTMCTFIKRYTYRLADKQDQKSESQSAHRQLMSEFVTDVT